MPHNFLAIDLGAESGRAILATLDNEHLSLTDIHRFANGPVRLPDGLHWDILRLWSEIKTALHIATYQHNAQLAGIGIDTWGVDYGLLDRAGALIGNPFHYRDQRTDGYKDTPVDRFAPRERLKDALDKILAEPIDPQVNLDSIEGKLFGLGAESYTVGSHEFYLGYAIVNQTLLTLDAGHFHPTETIADKISSVLLYVPQLLLHVSRGVRWDSDHVVIYNDELLAIAQEIVRGGFLDRVHIGLDYFDASINRVAAYAIGARSTLRAVLTALLEPIELMKKVELTGDYSQQLALLEEIKSLPFGGVWDYHCLKHGVPVGLRFMDEVRTYEKKVLAKRS